MIQQPLHQRLQAVADTIAQGHPLDELGATYDGSDVVTISTHRGPAAFHYRDLQQIRQALEARRPNVPPVTVAHPLNDEKPVQLMITFDNP